MLKPDEVKNPSLWTRIRSRVMLAAGLIACCVPLLIPLAAGVLAGTPIAL